MTDFLKTSSAHLRIRSAEPGDTPLILEFIRALAAYEKLSHEVVADLEGLRVSLFGERKVAEALIAEYRGEPAGFAVYFHNFSTFLGKPGLYLEDLFVKPEYRSRGIGKELLLCVARIAVDRGCGRLEWAVLDWNEPAIQFYKKLGAVPMDDWTVFRLTEESLATLTSDE